MLFRRSIISRGPVSVGNKHMNGREGLTRVVRRVDTALLNLCKELADAVIMGPLGAGGDGGTIRLQDLPAREGILEVYFLMGRTMGVYGSVSELWRGCGEEAKVTWRIHVVYGMVFRE